MGIADLRSAVSQLCERHGVERLYLFGSRARSQDMSGRDFDFVVRFGEHPPGDYAKRYFGLLHDLEDQLESPVDLLTEPSVLKHELGKRIKAERVCVYESGGS